MSDFEFVGQILTINNCRVVLLPPELSQSLPTRGQVMAALDQRYGKSRHANQTPSRYARQTRQRHAPPVLFQPR